MEERCLAKKPSQSGKARTTSAQVSSTRNTTRHILAFCFIVSLVHTAITQCSMQSLSSHAVTSAISAGAGRRGVLRWLEGGVSGRRKDGIPAVSQHISTRPHTARCRTKADSRSYRSTIAIDRRRPLGVAPALSTTNPSRSARTMAGPYGTYEAVVVGAGPAGITCVGNLLERKVQPILWVDDAFRGGRINRKYREVPSNTKVGLFVEFATAVAPFRKIVSGLPSRDRWEEPSESDAVTANGKPDKLHDLRQLDQTKGCYLSHAADMTMILTEGLTKTPGVITQKGKVSEAMLDEGAGIWTVRLNSETSTAQDISSVQAKRLILCTGSSPTDTPLPVSTEGMQYLDLDNALSPSRMEHELLPLGPTTVAVVGASHSAILVLRNLYNLASSSKPDLKIKWFTRHSLRYAEYMDGWILRDNTGLKGEVAVWAKQHLEPGVFPKSDVSKYVEVFSYEKGAEKQTFEKHLPATDFVVQAIGYTRDPIPSLRTADGKEITPFYDHEKGSFEYTAGSGNGSAGERAKLPGVYGAGIAWPERVKDPYGNVEYAVGFFKFMKFVKRVSPAWN